MNKKQFIEEIDLVIKFIEENYTSVEAKPNILVLTKLKKCIINNSTQVPVTKKQLSKLIDIIEELTVKFSKSENEKLLNNVKAFICKDFLDKIK